MKDKQIWMVVCKASYEGEYNFTWWFKTKKEAVKFAKEKCEPDETKIIKAYWQEVK